MEWDHLTQAWKQLINRVVSPLNKATGSKSQPDSAFPDSAYVDSAFSVEPPAPYIPDWKRERGDSSLHLSC